MKKILITLVLLISTFCSFGQNIDTAALHLMQKSWDKLAAMKDINYRMTYIDTMIRESRFLVNTVKLDGTIKKDAYWHIKLDNNLEWLVRGTQKRIAIPDQHEVRYVLIDAIVCCQADNSYTSFYMTNESKPIVVSKSISEYEQLLSLYGFVRTHQSWLVNRNHIEAFKKADGGYLVMNNKMSVPVSRQRKHLLKDFS